MKYLTILSVFPITFGRKLKQLVNNEVKNEARSDRSLISDNAVFAWKGLTKRNEVSEPIF